MNTSLSHDQLIAAAKHNKVVFWPISRIYEQLSLVDHSELGQVIMARSVIRVKPISKGRLVRTRHFLTAKQEYFCQIVAPETQVMVGDLLNYKKDKPWRRKTKITKPQPAHP